MLHIDINHNPTVAINVAINAIFRVKKDMTEERGGHVIVVLCCVVEIFQQFFFVDYLCNIGKKQICLLPQNGFCITLSLVFVAKLPYARFGELFVVFTAVHPRTPYWLC